MSGYSILSENELAKKITEHDRDAIAELFTRYGEWLKGYAIVMLRDKDLANDVLQDLFFKFLKNGISGLDPSKPLLAYLRICMRNIVLDSVKKSARKEELYDEYIRFMAHSGTGVALEQLPFEELYEKILIQIQSLPPEQRKVLKLNWEENRNANEIAKMLNKPVTTVNKQLDTSRKKIRRVVEAWLRFNLLYLLFVLLPDADTKTKKISKADTQARSESRNTNGQHSV